MAPDTDIALLNKSIQRTPRSKWSTYETVRYQYLPLKIYITIKTTEKKTRTINMATKAMSGY